jgi:hypothetical protein
MQKLTRLVEYRGAPKTGGYFLTDFMKDRIDQVNAANWKNSFFLLATNSSSLICTSAYSHIYLFPAASHSLLVACSLWLAASLK